MANMVAKVADSGLRLTILLDAAIVDDLGGDARAVVPIVAGSSPVISAFALFKQLFDQRKMVPATWFCDRFVSKA